MRCAITRVLPEPAPAKINSGPSPIVTASRCCGLSCERNSVIKIFRHIFKHTIYWIQNRERHREWENLHREERANRNPLRLKRNDLTPTSMPLEILHLALMFLCSFLRIERAEVAALAGLWILLARVQ